MKRAIRVAICALSIAIPVTLVIGDTWAMAVLLAVSLLTLVAALVLT